MTTSHLEWPQQSRVIEVADLRNGELATFATPLDRNVTLLLPNPY